MGQFSLVVRIEPTYFILFLYISLLSFRAKEFARKSRAVRLSSLPYIAGVVVLSYGHWREVSRTMADSIFLSASSTTLGGAPVNHHGSSAVFPTGQSVRLELGRGRTTFCRPVPSSSQIARAFRVKDVGPRSPPQSPPGCYPCNVSVRLFWFIEPEYEPTLRTTQNTRSWVVAVAGGLRNAPNWTELWSVKLGIPGTVLTSKSQTVSCDGGSSRGIDIPNSYCK